MKHGLPFRALMTDLRASEYPRSIEGYRVVDLSIAVASETTGIISGFEKQREPTTCFGAIIGWEQVANIRRLESDTIDPVPAATPVHTVGAASQCADRGAESDPHPLRGSNLVIRNDCWALER